MYLVQFKMRKNLLLQYLSCPLAPKLGQLETILNIPFGQILEQLHDFSDVFKDFTPNIRYYEGS